MVVTDRLISSEMKDTLFSCHLSTSTTFDTISTIIVSSDGKIEQNWLGAYVGKVKNEVQDYFKVALPEPKS
jgi:hypothetical protein